MRISVQEQKEIRETANEVFGKKVKVILFGSRVHDTEKGGDIDILIESTEPAVDVEYSIFTEGESVEELRRWKGRT